MELIHCKELCTGYTSKHIVDNLTFSIYSSDFLSILGENGSGKTTLMRTILGLNKPLDGQIIFSDNLQRNEIGYLPQQTNVQRDFPASAFEVVLSGCLNGCKLPFYSSKQKNTARSKMELLNISDLSARCFHELSGGQQQRVLLARALCASSKLLLLDEPVAGLDPDAVSDMYDAIAELNKSGIAVIMITHDTEAALKYSTHILHIAKKPKFFGTAENYRDFLRKSRGEI